ncbi:hypothetical protein [Streptomyces sp. NPDC007905]|uniref:hypothetical protein n=1 Tax=Streptomyces sp. NPDC007905 TaxID=3364788 RepID=UPI0036E731BE
MPLNALFLDALKGLTEEQSVRWQALLKADAKFAATGTLSAALASYTRPAAERPSGLCALGGCVRLGSALGR